MKKTVLITGASSGIGKETARLFQKKGWNVIATMRSPENETDLTGLGHILITRLNVQDQPSIGNAVTEGINAFGRIDVLVNSAGYGLMGVFESSTPEQVRRQYEVNVLGLFDVTREVLPHMRVQGEGCIINLSSVGGAVGMPFGSLYNSTKFAVEGFSEALSHELVALGIAVKIIEPGSIATNFRGGIDLIQNQIPQYDPLLAGFFERYYTSTQHLAKATASDVADTIYLAATDGTSRLRYPVGDDAKYYIDSKQNNAEAVYVKLVRDAFIN